MPHKQCCGSGSTGSTCFWASLIRIRIYHHAKIVRKILIPTLFDFLSLNPKFSIPDQGPKIKIPDLGSSTNLCIFTPKIVSKLSEI
jgi:hypothetical protein